jgi:hypothetical protein
MGLDMYLYAQEKTENPSPDIEAEKIELGYWRKHRNLHRFVEEKWRDATGSEEDFNCIPFPLSKELCIEILQHSTNRDFPEGKSGFFFGTSTPYDDEYTIGVMHQALTYISKGYEVIYNSWW